MARQMDRLFLDANVLFSAAYREDSGLLELWTLKDATLCSSNYALEEARINLADNAQRNRLARLVQGVLLFDAVGRNLPTGLHLPEKDTPILLAAIEARATHLITGDVRHFGQYFGKRIEGVLILSPSEYLKTRGGEREDVVQNRP
jgi:predicted nucleic acid-binding protein